MDAKGWSDIAYSWLVDKNGTIYEGRGWGISGAHTVGYNSTAHAVCYIGNSSANAAPPVAKAAINAVIDEHNRRYGKGYVRPHNAVNSTACPGTDLTSWVNGGRSGGSSSGCRTEGIRRGMSGYPVVGLQALLNTANAKLAVDGDFGPATEKAVTAFNNFFKINSPNCRGVASKKTIDTLEFLKAKKSGTKPTPAPKPPKPKAPAKKPGKVVMKSGDSNYVVAGLQKMLNTVAGAKLDVDGDFGPATSGAVQNFQRYFKMDRRDGKVDEATWNFLNYLYDTKTTKARKSVPKKAKVPVKEPDPPVETSDESLIQKIIAILNKLIRSGDKEEAVAELDKVQKEVK